MGSFIYCVVYFFPPFGGGSGDDTAVVYGVLSSLYISYLCFVVQHVWEGFIFYFFALSYIVAAAQLQLLC